MNSKRIFTRYLLFLCGALLASGFYLSARFNAAYPAALGPRFKPEIKKEHIKGIEENQPELVLIGDSVLYEGVDPILLSEQLGEKSYAITVPGSGTASWYLVMKNIILQADHRPKYIVILFRNTMLTVPQYRTTGRYFELLGDFASKNEPLVAELAFINQMSPLERILEQYIPLYTMRLRIRDKLYNLLRYTPAVVLAGCNRECTDEAMGSVFGSNVDPLALNQMMEDASRVLYAPEEMDFDRQVDRSFLPYMIQLAQKNIVTLVFVRTKILGTEPLALVDYSQALDAYLWEQDHVFLVNFSDDPRITEEFHVDGLHMNNHGRREFTRMLADELRSIIR
ncbi:MAG: hypothetical protein QY332_21200 [Anaerolineales bacterium]|nr:MAG: hypothetical protein QY332_21200 [Anaerolineales bacterium]